MANPVEAGVSASWWRRAVIYEIYIRSFCDTNGDGVGDIAGIRSRLPYLRDLGIDALWITPWYRSPMIDGGYDVADYRDVDPLFGTLDDADGLLADAHALGLRVLIDVVPNHTSDRHPWFREALESGPGSPARGRYLFRRGKGPQGEQPPNDWQSIFGGPAWHRVREADGQPGEWYLHLFAPEQPDLDWSNPEVAAEFESILRFWFERGVDGIRIDVAMALVKDPALPDTGLGDGARALAPSRRVDPPFFDRDGVHEIWRSWRAIADGCEPARVFVGEVGVARPERLALYVRPDELHTVFNFEFLRCPWEARAMRMVIDTSRSVMGTVGAPTTWVLSNHDSPRHVTRYGRADTSLHVGEPDPGSPTDLALGMRRARAAALLMLSLPGGAYLYQGEELGLPQVDDLPEECLADSVWERSGRSVRGRDGCRVPIPWEGRGAPYGFGPPGSRPWLPQPADWGRLSATAQAGVAGSMLELYREALRIRRTHPGLGSEDMAWITSPDGTLLFERAAGFRCAVNLSGQALALPRVRTTLLRSDEGDRDELAPDTAAWYLVS